MPIVICPNCGAKNRVENRGPQYQPVCARCHAELPPPDSGGDGSPASHASAGAPGEARVIELTDSTFAPVVQQAGSVPVLVDCWAPWCGPCRMLAPTIEQIARDSGGRWIVGKLNVDENPRTAQTFGIASIPTLLIFRDGHLVDQVVGLQPKAAIEGRLAQA